MGDRKYNLYKIKGKSVDSWRKTKIKAYILCDDAEDALSDFKASYGEKWKIVTISKMPKNSSLSSKE